KVLINEILDGSAGRRFEDRIPLDRKFTVVHRTIKLGSRRRGDAVLADNGLAINLDVQKGLSAAHRCKGNTQEQQTKDVYHNFSVNLNGCSQNRAQIYDNLGLTLRNFFCLKQTPLRHKKKKHRR